MQKCNYSSNTLRNYSIYFPIHCWVDYHQKVSKNIISFSIILNFSIGRACVSHDTSFFLSCLFFPFLFCFAFFLLLSLYFCLLFLCHIFLFAIYLSNMPFFPCLFSIPISLACFFHHFFSSIFLFLSFYHYYAILLNYFICIFVIFSMYEVWELVCS